MAVDYTIKEKKGSNGKVRYQAQVWFEGKFITSKTFASRALAVEYKKQKLKEAASGALKSAKERKAQRTNEAMLDRSMAEWARLYVEAHSREHSGKRLAEYDLVGRLLEGKSLRAFSGKAGGELIARLAEEWRYTRLPRSRAPGAQCSSDAPISDQTLRLRLSALDRLIRFAISKLPEAVDFRGPTKPFGFKLPPAHRTKRARQPSDSEYAALLKYFGANSDMGHLLRLLDETGCRLSEVSQACGSAVVLFGIAGQLLGGALILHKHKTAAAVGSRVVPLSRHAAEVVYARKTLHGDGALFPAWKGSDEICKKFDEARRALSIEDLVAKDFRRAFINRNVRNVPAVEMLHVVGNSSLIDKKQLSDGERTVQAAVGHTSLETTLGYVTPEHQRLAQVFTQTSRWPRMVQLIASPEDAGSASTSFEETLDLERELAKLLARMAHVGLITKTF